LVEGASVFRFFPLFFLSSFSLRSLPRSNERDSIPIRRVRVRRVAEPGRLDRHEGLAALVTRGRFFFLLVIERGEGERARGFKKRGWPFFPLAHSLSLPLPVLSPEAPRASPESCRSPESVLRRLGSAKEAKESFFSGFRVRVFSLFLVITEG